MTEDYSVPDFKGQVLLELEKIVKKMNNLTMEENEKYCYLYMIIFKDHRFYIGSRKSKVSATDDVNYYGSPVTFKYLWEDVSLSKTKYILKECNSFNEMRTLESELIKYAWKKFPDFCLNRCASPVMHREISKKWGKINGNKLYQQKKGIFKLSREQRSENGRRAAKRQQELGIGISFLSKKQLSKNGTKGGQKSYELGVGVHGLTPEQRTKISRKNGEYIRDNKIGMFSRTSEEISETSKRACKKTNSQRWMCLETGHISTPGPLTLYQTKRGIDISKRIRLE